MGRERKLDGAAKKVGRLCVLEIQRTGLHPNQGFSQIWPDGHMETVLSNQRTGPVYSKNINQGSQGAKNRLGTQHQQQPGFSRKGPKNGVWNITTVLTNQRTSLTYNHGSQNPKELVKPQSSLPGIFHKREISFELIYFFIQKLAISLIF